EEGGSDSDWSVRGQGVLRAVQQESRKGQLDGMRKIDSHALRMSDHEDNLLGNSLGLWRLKSTCLGMMFWRLV
ncbi:hypothetical protein A2U01_0080908, partial [Trifolium medium]|nr:hypothetical protein [Trifolium medium]